MQRKTQQRAAIRDALRAADRPLSPAEILDAARRTVPGLGIATVYRTIRSLVDRGAINTVDLPGAPSRYEVAGKDHHHHFHCRRCDRVYEVDACPGSLREITPRGFTLEAHEVVLYGTCQRCAAEPVGVRG